MAVLKSWPWRARRLTLVLVGGLVLVAGCSEESSGPDAEEADDSEVSIPATDDSGEPTSAADDSEAVASSVDVSFPSGDLNLEGTLRLPAASGPVPAVVLVHGSGPQSRDVRLGGQLNMAFGFEIAVFAELANELQGQGLAVLTYDKRTCTVFNGCSDSPYPAPAADLTVDVFVNDARAAIDYLRSRPEIDADAISVLGHSQGAEFVPLLLDADRSLRSGIMVAAPFSPIDQILEDQLDLTIDLLVANGMTAADAAAIPSVAAAATLVEAVAAIRDGATEPAGGASATFWRSWIDLNQRARAAAQRLTQPVLLFSGDLDWNVAPAETHRWADHLDAAGVDHTTTVLACITHALNCVNEPNPQLMTPDNIGTHIHQSVTSQVTAFLNP